MFRISSVSPQPIKLQPRWEADRKRFVCFPGEGCNSSVVVPQVISAFHVGPGLVYAYRRPGQGLQYLELQS